MNGGLQGCNAEGSAHDYTHSRSKVWGRQDFLMFLKDVSNAHQACIYLIKNTVRKNIILQFKINAFCIKMSFIPVMQIITPVFSFTSSFRNQSNILIYCSRNIIIIIIIVFASTFYQFNAPC